MDPARNERSRSAPVPASCARCKSLGYDAQSLDYDARFLDAFARSRPRWSSTRCMDRAAKTDTCRRCSIFSAFRTPEAAWKPSALAMDKHLTKKLLAAEGLPTAAWDIFDLSGGTLPLLPGSLDLPLVIKPRFEGSSQGVAIVSTHEQWTSAMLAAAKTYSQIMAEEFLEAASSPSRFWAKKRFRSSKLFQTPMNSIRSMQSMRRAAARTSCPRGSTKISPRACR